MSATASQHHNIPDALMDELLSEITETLPQNAYDTIHSTKKGANNNMISQESKTEEADIDTSQQMQQLENIIKLQKKEIQIERKNHEKVKTKQRKVVANKNNEIFSLKTELNLMNQKYGILQETLHDHDSYAQTIQELKEKAGDQQSQISLMNQMITSLQNELQQQQFKEADLKMKNTQLTQKNVSLTDKMTQMYSSLFSSLSFEMDAKCAWYQKKVDHEMNVIPVKTQGKKIGFLNGSIEHQKKAKISPHVVDDMEQLCKYVTSLREHTESALLTVNIPQDEEEEEDKNDLFLDLGGFDMKDLARQQSVYNCLICMDAKPNMFNYPCGHACYCSACAVEAVQINNMCPNCRQEITQCLNIFSGGFKED